MTNSYLPEILRMIADEVGLKEALALAAEYGGQMIYIPKKINTKSTLYERIGEETLEVLIEAYGGETILIPLGNASGYKKIQTQIDRLILETNKSNNQIVKELKVHIRTVIRHRQRLKTRNQRQLDLFK